MFERQQTDLLETIDARKRIIANEEAWNLLKGAEEIVVGKGKKTLSYKPSEDDKAEIMEHCLGRTGNLRAPALKIGSRFLIGFNEEMYHQFLGK